MKLIDADALYEVIEDHVTTVSVCPSVDWAMGKTQFKKMCLEDIKSAPAVDAVPVAHGRWEFCGDDHLLCSVCNARYFKGWLVQSYCTGPGSDPMDGFWHCPHCGALLDGGEPTCGPDYCEIGGD